MVITGWAESAAVAVSSTCTGFFSRGRGIVVLIAAYKDKTEKESGYGRSKWKDDKVLFHDAGLKHLLDKQAPVSVALKYC